MLFSSYVGSFFASFLVSIFCRFWIDSGVIVGGFWESKSVILGIDFWHRFAMVFGSDFGVLFGSFWEAFGNLCKLFGAFWKPFGDTLGRFGLH